MAPTRMHLGKSTDLPPDYQMIAAFQKAAAAALLNEPLSTQTRGLAAYRSILEPHMGLRSLQAPLEAWRAATRPRTRSWFRRPRAWSAPAAREWKGVVLAELVRDHRRDPRNWRVAPATWSACRSLRKDVPRPPAPPKWHRSVDEQEALKRLMKDHGYSATRLGGLIRWLGQKSRCDDVAAFIDALEGERLALCVACGEDDHGSPVAAACDHRYWGRGRVEGTPCPTCGLVYVRQDETYCYPSRHINGGGLVSLVPAWSLHTWLRDRLSAERLKHGKEVLKAEALELAHVTIAAVYVQRNATQYGLVRRAFHRDEACAKYAERYRHLRTTRMLADIPVLAPSAIEHKYPDLIDELRDQLRIRAAVAARTTRRAAKTISRKWQQRKAREAAEQRQRDRDTAAARHARSARRDHALSVRAEASTRLRSAKADAKAAVGFYAKAAAAAGADDADAAVDAAGLGHSDDMKRQIEAARLKTETLRTSWTCDRPECAHREPFRSERRHQMHMRNHLKDDVRAAELKARKTVAGKERLLREKAFLDDLAAARETKAAERAVDAALHDKVERGARDRRWHAMQHRRRGGGGGSFAGGSSATPSLAGLGFAGGSSATPSLAGLDDLSLASRGGEGGYDDDAQSVSSMGSMGSFGSFGSLGSYGSLPVVPGTADSYGRLIIGSAHNRPRTPAQLVPQLHLVQAIGVPEAFAPPAVPVRGKCLVGHAAKCALRIGPPLDNPLDLDDASSVASGGSLESAGDHAYVRRGSAGSTSLAASGASSGEASGPLGRLAGTGISAVHCIVHAARRQQETAESAAGSWRVTVFDNRSRGGTWVLTRDGVARAPASTSRPLELRHGDKVLLGRHGDSVRSGVPTLFELIYELKIPGMDGRVAPDEGPLPSTAAPATDDAAAELRRWRRRRARHRKAQGRRDKRKRHVVKGMPENKTVYVPIDQRVKTSHARVVKGAPWDLDNAMTHELGPDERARAAQRRAEDADDDSLVLPPLRGRM